MQTIAHRTPLQKSRFLSSIFALAVALTGCGGGGGSGGNASTDAMSAALASGDASKLSAAQVMEGLQSRFTVAQTQYAQMRSALKTDLGPTGIDWDPTIAAVSWQILDRLQNQPILVSNWRFGIGAAADNTGVTLAVAGRYPDSQARYAAFGGNPMLTTKNTAMDSFVRKTILWLTPSVAPARPLKIAMAHFIDGVDKEQKIRKWFVDQFPNVTINGIANSPETQTNSLCDGSRLANCLAMADLLVLGGDDLGNRDSAVVLATLHSALQRGMPVLYLHRSNNVNPLSSGVLKEFRLTFASNSHYDWGANGYWNLGLKAYSPESQPTDPAIQSLSALVQHLARKDFSTNWSGCGGVDRIDCNANAAHMGEFFNPADAIRTSLRALEGTGVEIFSQGGYELEKLMVLLGDKYREETSYYAPTNNPKDGTAYYLKKENTQTFYRAYFSDMAYFALRAYSTIARDLGTFANPIPPSVIGQTQTVAVDLPTKGTRDYMTGLYVMPGRTVSLTRTDSGTGKVRFGVNMLRDSTWVYNQLDRPTLLSSPRPELKAGQTLTITNPYGGPLFLFVDATSTQQPKVSVQVSGVTVHPVLRDATDEQAVNRFVQDVSNTPTSWIGITTDMLTIHSTRKHFLESINLYKEKGGIQQLVADTWTYTIKDTYELAGFNASSGKLNLDQKILAFCNSKGWDCTGIQHRRDEMQHVISDAHAYCGNGCSGNPYDEDWAFDPLGWGESHEIGHNLQVSRLSIYGDKDRSGEVSNNIFPVHKHIHYNEDKNSLVFEDQMASIDGNLLKTDCTTQKQSLASCVLQILKAGTAPGANPNLVYSKIWDNGDKFFERLTFYRQWVEYARHYNGAALGDGWALFTLMYLLDRNFNLANSTKTWGTVAEKYGFGTFASSFPGSMSANDFSLIASSYIIGKDMRPMFDLWGITYTVDASAQVKAYGFDPVEKLFFPMASLSPRVGSPAKPIVVTPNANYPSGY